MALVPSIALTLTKSPQQWQVNDQHNPTYPTYKFRNGIPKRLCGNVGYPAKDTFPFPTKSALIGKPIDSNFHGFLLQECPNMEQLNQFHARMIINGLRQNVFLATKLVSMYALCGCPVDARRVFEEILKPDVFLWNAMISGYVTNGLWEEALTLYYQMLGVGIQPDGITFSCALKACAGLLDLQRGKEIHNHIIVRGYESGLFVGNTLVSLYAKCGNIDVARHVFDEMSQRNVVSWNAMIAGYAHRGHPEEALKLFRLMQLTDVKSNRATIASALSACAQKASLKRGKDIHGYIIRNGFESDVFVCSSLIDMYSKCARIEIARRVFDQISQNNVGVWNAMIVGYTRNEHGDEALNLFRELQLAGLKPDVITIMSVLPACVHLAALQQGKEIHGYVIRSEFELDVVVENSLVAMYGKCGSLQSASQIFDKMSQRNVVSWTAMILGHTLNGNDIESLSIFQKMQMAGVKPNTVTLANILPACMHLEALQQGKEIHAYIIKSGFESDVFVGSALIDMYAKCREIEVACHVFDKMSTNDVVSWSTMIAGYAQNGHANEALKLFGQMQSAGVKPTSVTIVNILPVCAHFAALQQGKIIHDYVIRRGFALDVFVGSALIDVYAKCGSVEVARLVFNRMSWKNVVTWNAMIDGYGMNGHGEDALMLFDQMQQVGMKPDHITFTAILCACSHAGLVDRGWQYFNCMSQEYRITPRMEHYACMVDLLGRAGQLDSAYDLIQKMPLQPNSGVWGALLGACRIHCNKKMGEFAAERLCELEPENPGYYVLLSNIYAAAGLRGDVAKVRAMMKNKGIEKMPGGSWIEVKNQIHTFLVGDRSHPQSDKIYSMLESLAGQMEKAGYVPDTNIVMQDAMEEEKELALCGHSEKVAIAFGLIETCPGTPIRITKNLRICGDCHSATKFISRIVERKIIIRDTNRFHHFSDGFCSCGDYW